LTLSLWVGTAASASADQQSTTPTTPTAAYHGPIVDKIHLLFRRTNTYRTMMLQPRLQYGFAAEHARSYTTRLAILRGWQARFSATYRTYHSRYGYGVWDRLAMCETQGNWNWGAQYGNPTFEGGIGFYHGTWLAYRPAGYPEHAYQATRVQQINVGRRVLADVGPSAWGCASVAGLYAGA
jgi:hypothetical protein